MCSGDSFSAFYFVCKLECTGQALFKLHNVFLPELTGFKGRRVVAFRKNLIEMAELEIKHAKVSSTIQLRAA